jgi:DNA-binding transcriptional LysR family regulator
MMPTEFVKKMLPVLRQGMRSVERSISIEKNFDPANDPHTFYIGACDYFEFIAMPELTAVCNKVAPNVRISVDINSEHIKMDRVEGGQLDLYVGVDNIQHIPNNFNRHPWITDSYVGVVAKWRDIPERLSLNQFAAESQIHLPISSSGADVIDNWLHQQNLYRQIQMIAQSYAVGGRISARSGLLFCAPMKVASELVEMLPLKIVELPEGMPCLSLSILSHKLYDYHGSVKWLLKQILTIK